MAISFKYGLIILVGVKLSKKPNLFNVSNCAIDKNGTLKYVDLDGIEQFDSKQEMMNSEHYKNAMGILTEINNYYNKKNGKDNSK